MSLLILDNFSLLPETKLYLSTVGIDTTANRKKIINNFIKQLQIDNNWTLLDRIYLFANYNSAAALVSLINPSSAKITEVNSPTFTTDSGYQSNGTTSYLNMNYNPSTQGVNLTLNSASLGVYSRTNISETTFDIGSFDATNRCYISSRRAGDLNFSNINSGATPSSVANTNSTGLISVSRTSNVLTTKYRNGINLGTIADASTIIPNLNLYILALNSSGTSANFSNRQISCAFAGSGTINHLKMFNAIETYMDNIGAGVI